MPSSRRARRWAGLGALLCVLLGAAAVVLARELRGPAEVSNADVEFSVEQAPEAAPVERGEPSRADHPMDDGFRWPMYGYTKSRTKYFPMRTPLRPPFVEQWAVRGSILLEYPPASCGRSLFLLKNNGALYAISRLDGRVRWKRKLGYLAASSPGCAGDSVYVTILQRGKGAGGGRVVAVDASDGRTRWSRRLPSRSESSPLLDRGLVVFGSEDGTVYALRARDGAVRWRYRAAGAVKGGVALSDDRLFFGDYGGVVHAIRRRDGRRVWTSRSAGGAFGRTGRIYATPAVAYGRVFLGSLDGFVYSFSARDGRLAWRTRTGGYVYSSPAVAPVDRVGPTVFAGSYDGRLYAFDARSGRVRWRHGSGGKVSGGPQVIGDLVFYSDWGRKSTAAVGAATGRRVWSTDRGAFHPAIADDRRLYLVGYSSLFQLTTRKQARRDRRALRRIEARREARREAARPSAAERRRARAERTRATRARAERLRERRARRRAEERRRRALTRRVIARQRLLRENRRLRREGIEVCFRSGGKRVCRVPRPLVCARRPSDSRTVCRPRGQR